MHKKNNIGNHGPDMGIDEAHLLAYIDGSLPPEEQHRLEEVLETDPFLSDALEGLSEIKDKEQLRAIAVQINARLRRQIQSRRQRRRFRARLGDRWGWVFVLILLLLIVLGWWVIKMMLK